MNFLQSVTTWNFVLLYNYQYKNIYLYIKEKKWHIFYLKRDFKNKNKNNPKTHLIDQCDKILIISGFN